MGNVDYNIENTNHFRERT